MNIVTAAVIFDKDKVLITRRAEGQKHEGWWEFPGGKIEEGETPECCLQRELKEELGIEAHVGEMIAESTFSYATGSIRLLAYRATIVSGELCLRVHDDYRWVSAPNLMTYQLLPADMPIAQYLQQQYIKKSQAGGTSC